MTRVGLGAMRLADVDGAVRLLRRAVELGVTLVDAAGSEQLVRRALHPYPAGLVIAARVGVTRTTEGRWEANGHPRILRQQADRLLKDFGLERIPLLQLHRIDPTVPLADQLGALTELQSEGKAEQLALSEVTVGQLRAAQALARISAVQNVFNLAQRGSEPVLEHCEAHDIAFLPGAPLAAGRLVGAGGLLERTASRIGVTPAQVALAWLLRRSPVMRPTPGTTSVAHLGQNLRAGEMVLADGDFDVLAKVR